MNRTLFNVLYCLTASFVMAVMFISLGYPFAHSFALGTMFLPGGLLLNYCLQLPEFNREKVNVLHIIYILLGGVIFQEFLMLLCHWYFMILDKALCINMSPLFANPIFLVFMLMALAVGQFYLNRQMQQRDKAVINKITFTSNYKKITLETGNILYVESRDTEVYIYTVDGELYKSQRPISQWENILEDNFIRIHRAFLVNKTMISLSGNDCVCCAGKQLPVSRKYKKAVQALFSM